MCSRLERSDNRLELGVFSRPLQSCFGNLVLSRGSPPTDPDSPTAARDSRGPVTSAPAREGEAAWREPGAGQGKDETEGKRGKADGWMGGRVAIAETTKNGYLNLADLADLARRT